MQSCNLPDEGETETHTAIVPAAGLIHPEKRLKNALLKLRRYAFAAVSHANVDFFFHRDNGDKNAPIGAIVFDGIFAEIEEQPVDQGVTAADAGVALSFKADFIFSASGVRSVKISSIMGRSWIVSLRSTF